jgi:NAD(P)-dependent dehydrogenase (short-subunit alcohol dehydrogenase family)
MNRVVLITGASRGIGLELCRQYKKSDDQVIAICRNASSELTSLNVQIIENVDVTKETECLSLAQSLSSERKIDILINNAGVLHCETLNNMNFAHIEEQFKVNALAPLQVTHALLNKLNKSAKIAVISSRMGSIEDNTSGAYYGYRMSKAAINMAFTSLAIDLKPKNISVAILHPGLVQTRMTNFNGDITPTESAQRLYQRIEELNINNSGQFLHSNGTPLPW